MTVLEVEYVLMELTSTVNIQPISLFGMKSGIREVSGCILNDLDVGVRQLLTTKCGL